MKYDVVVGDPHHCGADARIVRGSYRFRESGLPVLLVGIEIVRCKQCGGEEPIIPQVDELMTTLAEAVIRKPWGLKGEEVRFLRKYIRMNQEEFAGLIHVDKTTLSKWETNNLPVGDQSDRLIRAICLLVGEGLKEQGEASVLAFPAIKAAAKSVSIQVMPCRNWCAVRLPQGWMVCDSIRKAKRAMRKAGTQTADTLCYGSD